MRIWTGGALVLGLGVAAVWGAGEVLEAQTRAALAQTGGAVQGTVAAEGFPTRIGLRLSDLAMTDPGLGVSWQVPKAHVSAPVWAPLSWQVQLEMPQRLDLGGQRFTLAATRAEARFEMGAAPDLPLRKARADLAEASLTYEPAAAPSLAMQALDMTAEAMPKPGVYAVRAKAEAIGLPPRLAAALTPQARLPDVIESLSLSATATLAAPLALTSSATPEVRGLDISAADLTWGGHRLSLAGSLAVDAQGYPEGLLTLALHDWQAWLDLARGAGLIAPERAAMAQAMAGQMAAQSPDGVVRLPIGFRGGMVSLMGLPLGPAPRLQ